MTVSADSFDKLSEKIDSAKSAIKAAASQSEAELKAKVEEARKTADDRASELGVQTRTTGESVDTHWGQIQADWERHRQAVRRRLSEAKTGEDLEAAELRAELAEDDAADAIDFAANAIDEATYAMLDAIAASKDVNDLAAAASS
jgi:hypothetical protein